MKRDNDTENKNKIFNSKFESMQFQFYKAKIKFK